MKPLIHYRVELFAVQEPTVVSEQAIRSCSNCGILLGDRGGVC